MLSRSNLCRLLLIVGAIGMFQAVDKVYADDNSPPANDPVAIVTTDTSLDKPIVEELPTTKVDDSSVNSIIDDTANKQIDEVNEISEPLGNDKQAISTESSNEETSSSKLTILEKELADVKEEVNTNEELSVDEYSSSIPIDIKLEDEDKVKDSKQSFFSSSSNLEPTIDEKILVDALDNYLANATQEELTMFSQAVDEDKEKILEYIIQNQINEEYVARELSEIKQYLTAEEIKQLDDSKTPQEFQNVLKKHIISYIQRRDFEILLDQLIVDSTREEFDRLVTAKTDEELKTVFLEMAKARENYTPPTTNTSNFRAGGAVAALPWIVKSAPAIVAAATKVIGFGVAVASSPITLGVAAGVVAYTGYKAYTHYKTQSQRRIIQRQVNYNRARQSEINRQYSVKIAAKVAKNNIQRARTQISHITTSKATTWSNPYQVAKRTYGQASVNAMRQSSYNTSFNNQRIKTPQYKKASAVANKGTHTVKTGESVWGISHKYGIKMSDLIKWNNIVNNTIHPGQQLKVSDVISMTFTNGTHTVQSGESVWSISHKYNISMAELISWNNISNNTIHPNQKLVVTKPSSSVSTHIVKVGESVWGISHKYGISMDDLIKWNGIVNNTIHPSQTLKISAPTTNETEDYHRVRSGESLWLIANRYGVKIDDLRKWNAITGTLIHPDQVIRLFPKPKEEFTGITYTVQKGDSLWSISNKLKISIEDLITWNDLTDNTLHERQILRASGITNKEARKVAEDLGYEEVASTDNTLIFHNKKARNGKPKYISPDQSGHGKNQKGEKVYWKGADRLKDLKQKHSRNGTYDKDLNKVRD